MIRMGELWPCVFPR